MYRVTFQYDKVDENPDKGYFTQTTATVFGPNNDIVATGYALCVPEDQFKKSVGRKLALTRALSCFDRPMRRAVWHSVLAKGMKV